MALKSLDCARVLPGGGCTLILIGEPEEVLTAYEQHRRERAHAVNEVEPGREPEYQLQNVVFAMPAKAFVGDDFEVDGNTVRIPGPGVVIQRFGEDTASLSCKCSAGNTGDCRMEVSGGSVATCARDGCTGRCTFDVVVTGFTEDKTLAEFLTR